MACDVPTRPETAPTLPDSAVHMKWKWKSLWRASCRRPRDDDVEPGRDVGVVLLVLDGGADGAAEGVGPGGAALGQHGRGLRPVDGLGDAGRLGERLAPET